MKRAHKNIWIPQLIGSCLTSYDIEIKQNYVISHYTYDIKYKKGRQQQINKPTPRFVFN